MAHPKVRVLQNFKNWCKTVNLTAFGPHNSISVNQMPIFYSIIFFVELLYIFVNQIVV